MLSSLPILSAGLHDRQRAIAQRSSVLTCQKRAERLNAFCRVQLPIASNRSPRRMAKQPAF